MATERGSIHGRPKGAALTVEELFPAKTNAFALGRGHKGRGHKGRTKHGKAGMHGRHRTPIAAEARKDPWKHKDQASRQG